MSKFLVLFKNVVQQGWFRFWQHPSWLALLEGGDETQLKKLPSGKGYQYLPEELLTELGAPREMDAVGQLFVRAMAAVDQPGVLGEWIKRFPQHLDDGLTVFRDLGIGRRFVAEVVLQAKVPLTDAQGRLSAAGRLVADLSAAELREILDAKQHRHWSYQPFADLAVHSSKQLATALKGLDIEPDSPFSHSSGWEEVARANPTVFVPIAAAALPKLRTTYQQFELGRCLAALDHQRFAQIVEDTATKMLVGKGPRSSIPLWDEAKDAAIWLVENTGQKCVAKLHEYAAAPLETDKWRRQNQSDYKIEVLKAAAKLGPAAIPLYEACFRTDQGAVQLAALEHWIALRDPAQAEAIAGHLRTAFAGADTQSVARAVRLAGDFDLRRVEADVWPLLAHKSRGVREAAAVTLAKLGEARLPRVRELWSAKKADTRIAAVSWLKALGTPAALAALRDRLDDEENDDVRDAILLALDQAGGGAAADPAELKRRMKATLAKLDGPPVKWLAVKKLPAAKLNSGKALDTDSLLYLLHRQSRVKDIRADLEARPLYGQVDRATSGDLALAVFHAWQGAGADADHRWVLAFAALLGDDRLVPLLTRQIRDWAEAARGKLSEYAVQALALLGTDTALLAVDALAIRYRSKFKNIGKAATEAFAEAAAARGLTPEELGDRVVPWLGFEPGKPRVIACGKTQVEVRLGGDFKFAFRDATSGKKLAKLPDSAPADVKAEFKELAASLKEAVKAQHLRMEALMVRQFRWPVARFRELYLAHPLLIPFAQRLVWGHFAAGGKLTATFRTLDDLSLTDAADEPVTLPPKGEVGVVHPLELPADVRAAWVKHLADYAVEPPFAQLDRPVIAPTPNQAAQKFGKDLAGTELNAMTFKGRAERLGWARGSVCDAGGINYYRKTFPNAGVEVFLGLEGMFVGVDMYSDVTLGDWFFVRSGSVKIGSYEYDEPGNDTDPRLVPLGAVPPIAYSEALGDLARIAGKGAESGASTEEG